jgi:DNA polymerase III delta subunit
MTLFFYGPNTYALRQQVNEMIEAYRAKSVTDFGLERIDGAAIKPRELQAALQAAPFMANSRLVIIDGLGGNKAMGERIEAILGVVPTTTVAVFAEREVDQRTIIFKALMKADKVVKFDLLSGPQLLAWCKHEVERQGGSAERAALQELIDRAGEDQWRLSGEITKLVNYDLKITPEAVRELVTPSLDTTIFNLVETMSAGRGSEALASYHTLLRQKQSEIYILTMIQWQLRNLLFAKTGARLSQAELAKEAGMSPYVAGKMLTAQRSFDEDMLASAYREAADCEYDIKTGRVKAEVGVEQLIYRVATLAKA